MSDEDFERHALAVCRANRGWTVWLASSACIGPAPVTTPATATAWFEGATIQEIMAEVERRDKPAPRRLRTFRSLAAIVGSQGISQQELGAAVSLTASPDVMEGKRTLR